MSNDSDNKELLVERFCISCDKQLRSSRDNSTLMPTDYGPSSGVIFYTTGNYGSSVFDSIMGEEKLEIVVCDECLKKKGKHALLFYGEGKKEVKPFIQSSEIREQLDAADITTIVIPTIQIDDEIFNIIHSYCNLDDDDKEVIIYCPVFRLGD